MQTEHKNDKNLDKFLMNLEAVDFNSDIEELKFK